MDIRIVLNHVDGKLIPPAPSEYEGKLDEAHKRMERWERSVNRSLVERLRASTHELH